VLLLVPVGEVESSPQVFRWRRSPDAARYRFELLDFEAQPLLQAVVVDTFWAPAQGDTAPPSRGSWHVTPLDDLLMDLSESSSATYRTRN